MCDNMKINKLADDVYEVLDFLTENDLSEVYVVIDSLSEDDWFSDKTPQDKDFYDFWNGKNIEFDHATIFDSINEKMMSLFDSYHYFQKKLPLQRYRTGDHIKQHRDQWNPDLPYYIGYGFCLYYNDDYAGGELEYPELNIKVKPKSNSLYIHGGNVLHGSLPVLDDKVRYFSTTFIRGTGEEPTILRKDMFK